MTLVVDAKVAIKWFVEESRADGARVVLASGEPLVAPDLVVPEACSAAWKKVQPGEISEEQAAAVARALPMSFDRLMVTAELAPRAFALGHRFNHPVYDCFSLALAEADSATWVTDDTQVLTLARRAGLARWVRPLRDFAKRIR